MLTSSRWRYFSKYLIFCWFVLFGRDFFVVDFGLDIDVDVDVVVVVVSGENPEPLALSLSIPSSNAVIVPVVGECRLRNEGMASTFVVVTPFRMRFGSIDWNQMRLPYHWPSGVGMCCHSRFFSLMAGVRACVRAFVRSFGV